MALLIDSKPWSDKLESSLSSLSPSLSKNSVFQTLQLIGIPARALQFFDWVQKRGFAHDEQSFFLMLEILGRARNLNAARNFLFSIEKRSNGSVKLEDRFFNSLIRSYGNAGLFQESIKLFESMRSMGISSSVVTFNSVLSILLKRGRTNMAQSLFGEMLRTYGVTPDVYTFNILIRGFCKNSMLDEGFRFFKEMEQFKCEPDVITYNTIIDGLCRSGKVRIAHNVVKGMNKKREDLHPNVVTYTTLVRGYCVRQEIEEAMVVFEEIISRGLKPNQITCNTLIKGLCEAKKYDKIKEILEKMMQVGGFKPDTCTFNTLMNAHCKAGNSEEALKVFHKMSALQVQPDSATYNVLIRSLCQQGDFERGEKLFDEVSEKEILLSNVGCRPLVAAYNPMFEYLCANGKTDKAERVFRQLMKRGIQDPSSYRTLIMGHCKEGTFKSGYELLVLMLQRAFVPELETYVLLINGLLKTGEALLAYKALEKMVKSSHLPSTAIYHSTLEELVKKKCAHESASLIMLMLGKRVRQNITHTTSAVRLIFCSGFRDKAFMIIHLLYDNGYVIEMEELIGFFCKQRKLIEAHKLLLFCLEKHQRIDIDLCNMVIEGICESNRLSEAFSLYCQLVERGNHQQLRSLEKLKIALQAARRLDEAEFVSKRMIKELAIR